MRAPPSIVAVFVVLAATATACRDAGCTSPDRDFMQAGELTEADVEAILAAHGYNGRYQITCEDACEQLYVKELGQQPGIVSIADCDHDIELLGYDDPKTVVGEVECSGRDNPNVCE